MWTCTKCGGNVADRLPACQSCGTSADGTAAPPPPTADNVDVPLRADATPLPPPELRAVEPPPPMLQDRLLRAAKSGAIFGALYGIMYCSIMWCSLFMLNAKFPNGPAAALGEVLTRGALIGAAVGVPVAVLFRLVFPYKPPRRKS